MDYKANQHPFINIAVTAARRAGRIISRYFGELEALKIEEKGINDLVTMVDRAAENEIIELIQKTYPNHRILGEETGLHEGNDDYTWIIDPLDGTMNYTHGFPHFAVSIAVKHGNQLEHGVIYDPISQDLYTASRGSGAKLNDRRIRVSKYSSLTGSLIGTSFPFHERASELERHLKTFKELFDRCGDVRRTGSAALNLAYVASGKLDGFWEMGLKEWDIAAGALLVREAGGYVSDFKGENEFLVSGNILAGTRKVHAEILKIMENKTS